jgi:hypothetical protein
MTILEEDSPGRNELDNSPKLPNLHFRHIGVLEHEQDDIVQLKVTASNFLVRGDKERHPVKKDAIPVCEDLAVEIKHRLGCIVEHHLTVKVAVVVPPQLQTVGGDYLPT